MRNLVVYGVGELGKLFGAAALRAGIRVTPITRQANAREILDDVAEGTAKLIAVGESELDGVLSGLPARHRTDIILLQNELFPGSWSKHDLEPTVLVPWVLQKRGLATQAAGPSFFFGPQAQLLAELLAVLELPAQPLVDTQALQQALVDKYTFILTINALGLLVDRTLGLWLQEDSTRVWDICREATELGARLCDAHVVAEQARLATEQGMRALSAVPARGRTARDRVERAVAHATRLEQLVPSLQSALAKTR